MICPKCADLMQTVDRRGIHIERCAACKGIFLDGGELEQILTAEQQHYSSPPPYVPEEPAYPSAHGGHSPGRGPGPAPGYDPRHDRGHDPRYRRRKRRTDFLEDLLDFD